jgi:hypothetical protein
MRGLKYGGVGTTALGWILRGTLFAGVAVWLAYLRTWQQQHTPPEVSTGGGGVEGKEPESVTSPRATTPWSERRPVVITPAKVSE